MWNAIFIYNLIITIALTYSLAGFYFLYLQKSENKDLYLSLLFFFMIVDNSIIYLSEYSSSFRDLYETTYWIYFIIYGIFIGNLFAYRGFVEASIGYLPSKQVNLIWIIISILALVLFMLLPFYLGEFIIYSLFFIVIIYVSVKHRAFFSNFKKGNILFIIILAICCLGIVESLNYYLTYSDAYTQGRMSVFNEYRNFSFDLLKVITLIYSFSAIGHRFHQKEQTQSSAELIISFCREHELTDRQQDIVKMIVNGSTNKEISETLFITEGTVKTHIHNIFRKTGVTSRNQIIAKVLEK